MHREIVAVGGMYALWEQSEVCAGAFGNQNDALKPDNNILSEKSAESTETYLRPTRNSFHLEKVRRNIICLC